MLISILLPIVFWQFRPRAPAAPKPETILATVDDKTITAKDVEGYLWDWRGSEATQELINYTLISEEAKKNKVEVDEADLTSTIQKQLAQMRQGLPPGTTLEQAMIQRGLPMSRLEMRLRMDKILTQLVALSFDPTVFYRVSTMAVPIKSAATTDLSQAIKIADSAYARLMKGEAWATVLADITKSDPAIKNGGELGWFSLSEFPAAVQPALKSAKKGEITKPAQTQFGIQIFKVEGLGAELKGPELSALRMQYSQTARPDYAKKLQAAHKVVRLWPAGLDKG